MAETPSYTIRIASCEGARSIGEVHVASWLTTYRGIVADEFLDRATADERAELWQRLLCVESPRSFIYVAVVDGQIVGFAGGGPGRDSDPDFSSELYTLYLLQAQQRAGIGRALLTAVANRLVQEGHTNMLIWVLAQNPAVRFYEACGGVLARRKMIAWGGKDLEELGYGWSNLNTIH